MKNKFFVIVAVIIAALAFWIISMNTETTETITPTVTPTAQDSQLMGTPLFVRPHSPSLGSSMSKVTVVEWFDPECESCRLFHPYLEKIISQYKDRVHFVMRYMPFHKNSMYSASILCEAHELGMFEQALDLMFEKQPEWADHHKPKPELLPELLATIGFDKSKLNPEDIIKKHGEKVKTDQEDGTRLGVVGTPTFFVNGQMLEELDPNGLVLMIELALKK